MISSDGDDDAMDQIFDWMWCDNEKSTFSWFKIDSFRFIRCTEKCAAKYFNESNMVIAPIREFNLLRTDYDLSNFLPWAEFFFLLNWLGLN